jgi:hypothetical protein
MVKISLPSLPKFDVGGFKPGKVNPISSKPPDLPTSRPPSTKPKLDTDAAVPSTKSPDAPDAPVVKPPDDAPSTKLNPEPSKPSMFDNVRNSLLLGGGLTGVGLFAAGGLGSQAVNTAGNVATAAVAAEAAKEMFNKALEALGKFTENPINLAIVAGVIGLVVLR